MIYVPCEHAEYVADPNESLGGGVVNLAVVLPQEGHYQCSVFREFLGALSWTINPKTVIIQCAELKHQDMHTVKPLNNGHTWDQSFILCREVEYPLSEVPLNQRAMRNGFKQPNPTISSTLSPLSLFTWTHNILTSLHITC